MDLGPRLWGYRLQGVLIALIALAVLAGCVIAGYAAWWVLTALGAIARYG